MAEIRDGLQVGETFRAEVTSMPREDCEPTVVRVSAYDHDPGAVNLTLFAASDPPGAPRLTARLPLEELTDLLGDLRLMTGVLMGQALRAMIEGE